MQKFTAFEYLAIDIANQYGHDKMEYVDRIHWVIDNIHQLERLIDDVALKERPRYIKAVMVLRDAQAGKPVGHPVGLDAVCSGMQIMSALTGCESGMKATGLINTGKRPDAYTLVTKVMTRLLGRPVPNGRRGVKNAVMTRLYGSREEPIKEFGDGTPELECFYQALEEVSPGAVSLLNDLLSTWNPRTEAHEWYLPDGHRAYVPVMDTIQHKLEIDELGGATMLWQGKHQTRLPFAVSNAANVVHSIDAYIVRCLERELNYDERAVRHAQSLITEELLIFAISGNRSDHKHACSQESKERMQYLESIYSVCKCPDMKTVTLINVGNIHALSIPHLEELLEMVNWVLESKPFPIMTNHDEFKARAGDCQRMREAYNRTLARLHRSQLLTFIFQQMLGSSGQYRKYSNSDFTQQILEADYAIC